MARKLRSYDAFGNEIDMNPYELFEQEERRHAEAVQEWRASRWERSESEESRRCQVEKGKP